MGLIALSRDVELVYSPDDAAETGKGYYLQRYPSGDTSQLFRTQQEARNAFHRPESLVWDP